MIGRRLSHYDTIEEISRGGMGVVYRAADINRCPPARDRGISGATATWSAAGSRRRARKSVNAAPAPGVFSPMTDLLPDVRYSIRSLRRPSVTSAIVVASLAIGIAANTTVFSFVNAIQFKPLPVRDEATLVDLSETSATQLCAGCGVGTSYPGFLDWAERLQSLEAVGAYREERLVIGGDPSPAACIDPMLVLRSEWRLLPEQLQRARKLGFRNRDDRSGPPRARRGRGIRISHRDVRPGKLFDGLRQGAGPVRQLDEEHLLLGEPIACLRQRADRDVTVQHQQANDPFLPTGLGRRDRQQVHAPVREIAAEARERPDFVLQGQIELSGCRHERGL
jgi:hypothetical protein